MGKHFAQLIVGNLRDQCALAAQCCRTGQRIRSGTSADFACRTHVPIQFLRPVGIDQRHATLDQLLFVEKFVAGLGDHIYNCIADRDNIITGFGAHKSPLGAG